MKDKKDYMIISVGVREAFDKVNTWGFPVQW